MINDLLMTIDRIWYILGKKLSGDASQEELSELDSLLRAHPELCYPIQNIIDLWSVDKPIETLEARQALQKHLLRLGESDSQPRQLTARKKLNRTLIGLAVSVLIALMAVAAYFFMSPSSTLASQSGSPEKINRNEISTREGSHSKIVLPDGSIVWLNAKSKIEYNKDFDSNVRVVSLEGEAYFEVAKDSARPFIIHANNIDIKVLGTVFNVKSYQEDGYTETSLIEGEIEVSVRNNPGEKIRMKPSEKLVVRDHVVRDIHKVLGDSIIYKTKIGYESIDSTVTETLWMANRLVFRNKSFVDLAPELERKYGVVLHFSDQANETLEFTASFKNETIEQVLEALQLANPFNYHIKRDTIFITR